MPFQFHHITTESGLRYLRVDVSGHVDLDDGKALEAYLLPGAQYHLGYLMSVVAKGTVYSPEVRKFFPTLDRKYGALAAVVTSPIVRAAINMMLRIAANQPTFRMFTSEAEGIAWLEAAANKQKASGGR